MSSFDRRACDGLKSSLRRLHRELEHAGTRVTASIVTGMISQNNTPRALVPLLRWFDRPIFWGEYMVVIAERTMQTPA